MAKLSKFFVVKLDCANGIGGPQFRKTLELLQGKVAATIVNDGSDGGVLNEGVSNFAVFFFSPAAHKFLI